MKVKSRRHMVLFSGSANPELAKDIAEILGETLGDVDLSSFANGEIYVRYNQSVRGSHVFIIQSHSPPVNYHIMEQLLMIDAAKRASAMRITAVVPYFGYARQDKKVLPREPISARMMADMFLAAGADRLVSVDLHSGQIQGFVSQPFDSLTALPVFTEYLQAQGDGPWVVVSPDSGRVKVAERYARRLDARVAFIHKRRSKHNEAAALTVVGEVEGRHAVIVDDMIDTAGTVVGAADLVRAHGALSVTVMATHGLFSPPAIDRLKNANIDEIIVTNTLPMPDDIVHLHNVKVLSAAPLIADTIHAIFMDESVSEIFMGDNV